VTARQERKARREADRLQDATDRLIAETARMLGDAR
jgi:hypothetical protein